eukprot:Opistho-2@23934
MAKWGEGDPRWIVEERADATNVNNWHWTEKNATNWSKDRLKAILGAVTDSDDSYGSIKVSEVSKIEGEASANNRKAKLIFFYEWDIKLKWVGESTNKEEGKVAGEIEIPNLSEENDISEIEFNITSKKDSALADRFKQVLRKRFVPKLREALTLYLRQLREEFSQGLILPTKEKSDVTIGVDATEAKPANGAAGGVKISNGDAVPAKTAPVKAPAAPKETKTITMTEEFKASADDLYQTLVNPQRVQAFTQASVVLDASVNGNFMLFGGNVTGKFTELVPGKKICQTWRFSDWPKDHHSQVTIEFVQGEADTKLTLTQTGVPASDYERTERGWHSHYWNKIKGVFGYGAGFY